MYLIVGLGNPGKEYDDSRHNIGFRFIDAYAKIHHTLINQKKFNGLYGEFLHNNEKVILLKPQSYMNLSGKVVEQFLDYFQINIQHLLVINDDLDLPFAFCRLKKTGSSGGHNGLKDIELHLKTRDYYRLKIGISNSLEVDTKDYVLGRFSQLDIEQLSSLGEKVNNILDDFLILNFDQLMNKYNQKKM